MLVDANRIETTDRLAGDVCIIGGGIAGITIAMKLAGRGIRVHLVEGGGRRYSRRSQSLYDGVAWDDRYSLCGTRARLLGGTSNSWSGWTRPFGPVDFGRRPWLGAIGWPIEERDLAPYDAAASALLEVPPPEPDATLLASLDRDLSRASSVGGEALETIFFGKSPPTAFGRAYRRALERTEGLTVLLNATATRLETDPASDGIASVTVRTDRAELRVEASVFVLAAGGIENPRLLLASGGIGNGHDLVGRYFMDHPRVRLHRLSLDTASVAHLYDTRHYPGGLMLGSRGRTGAALSPSPAEQRRAKVLQSYTGFGACYFGHTGATLEDARQLAWALRGRLHEPMDAPRIVRAAASAPAALAYLLGRRLDLRGRRTRFEVATVIEPWPDPDNRVELLAETDRLGVPKVLVTWRRHEIERRTHRHAVDLVGRAIEAGGHGKMTIDPGVWEFDRWDRAVATTWHHMGTTRMGASPCGAVVDTDCRVFGTSNLYVAGSSVFPTGGSGPPTFTLTALALRLADHLALRLGERAVAEAQAPLRSLAFKI